MIILKNSKDCRSAYREILQGYTYIEEEELYVKHFTESDLGELEYLYKSCEKELQKKGVENEKEKLEFLKEEEHWSQNEEEEWISAKLAVQDAYAFQDKLVDPEQRENFKETIKNQEKLFDEINKERHSILEPTIESFCDKKLNEHYVRCSLFKDSTLKEPAISKEEFDNIPFSELNKFIVIYNEISHKFEDKNLSRIGVNSFFLNSFMMSDNDPVKFYGKSVLELTLYQLNLYNKGKYYKSILEEGKDPPNNLYELMDKNGMDPIVSWFDTAYNQIRTERERQKSEANRRRAQGR